MVILGYYILSKTKEVYGGGKLLPVGLSIAWWILDVSWVALVAASAFYSVWTLPLSNLLSLGGGSALLFMGIVIAFAGAIEFNSLRRVSGIEISRLVTTGIYSWSRNPQFLGFYLTLIGVSLLGRSGYSLLLSGLAIVSSHYYIVKIEEPFLEIVFGREYLIYRSRLPRYLEIKRKIGYKRNK